MPQLKKTIAALTLAVPFTFGTAFAAGPQDTVAGADRNAAAVAPTIDTNNDGKADAWDRDNNGTADAWDTNGDGKPDKYDDDGDGKPDKPSR